jgi:CO/xanthine dehydrogenase Mo-binding subunit
MIGNSIVRQDTIDKVTGEAKFAVDYCMPDTLHMKLKFAERPHARIRNIDISRAQNHPGVVAIFTAQDVPINRYGLIVGDQPVLCDEVVLFEGDQIAAIVAETPQQAAQAALLIKIDYQDLPILESPEQAMSAEAPTLHADFPDNLASTIRLRRGNTRSAFEVAPVIYENEYHTPMQEHIYLELEAGLAYIGEQGEVIVRAAGQNVHDDQRQIAKALDIPLEQIRVIYGPVGGAFGGREDISVQIVLALAAWKLKRPVQTNWNRSESICGHGKRHATKIKHRWGADENGKITAAEVDILINAGAYMYTSNSVLEGMLSTCIGPYDIPNVTVDGKAVFTNSVPGAAFRGYGSPQTGFAAELQITHMAELLGIDPITIRSRNCLRDGSHLPTQTPFPGESSLAELIDICARESGCQKTNRGWQMPTFVNQPNRQRGFGLAAGIKATGYGFGYPEGSEAKIVLRGGASIERAELFTAAADVGQGAHTVLVQIAAHVLEIPIEFIDIIPSDTSLCNDAGSAAASRLTYVAGNAVKLAAEMALQAWHDESRPAVGVARWEAPATTPPDPATGACIDNISYSFAAQGVTVEVDVETGIVHLDKVIAVQDVGRAINPKKIEGQIEGAIMQAMGWALIENFETSNGLVVSNSLSTYLVPTSQDIPSHVKCIQIEKPDPTGPFGVRGVGEVPFIPLAPAIISAIKDAIGVWFNHIPVKPEEVIAKIKEDNLA